MKVTTKKLPKSQVEVQIILETSEVQTYRKQALQKLSQEVKIDGFRKGHVPESVLVQRFGEQTIMGEAIDMGIPKIVMKALQQENLDLLDRPAVDIISPDPLTIQVLATVQPEVTLDKKWQDVKVKRKKITIEKKEREEVLTRLREQQKERKPVDRAAKKDDFVEINFAGKTPDGVPLEGTESKNHPMILGLNTFIPGFEDQMIGMKKGEEKEFEITFPKEYHAKNLAGKPVIFAVTMNEVCEQILPEIDESFAEKIFGKKMKKEEIEAEVDKILLEKAEDDEDRRLEGELLEKWAKLIKVDIPDLLIDQELGRMIHNIQHQAQHAGVAWDQYLAQMKKTEDDIRKESRGEAEKRVLQGLALRKAMEEAKIEVSDEEVTASLANNPPHQPAPEKETEEWERQRGIVRLEKLFDRFLKEKK